MLIPGGQTIGAIAAIVATTASVGAELTAKKPPRQGSVTQTTIGTDQASCEMLGRTFSPGARVQLVGYGADYKKVKNPYLLAVDVVGVGGPYDALETVLADQQPVGFSGNAATGYFSGFLYRSFQLGQQTEASALALQYPGAPGWGSDAKLSGKPAIAWNALFDKDGKVFASGFAPMGSVWRGVKAYDPRKDSTYPGGSGSHRWADPRDTAAFDAARATWEYTTSPGLLALRNVLGTWERHDATPGTTYRKVFGVGMPIDGVIVADFVHLANVCDANEWECGGRIFEPVGPGERWANLKRILAAGGAEPAWRGGLLGLKVQAPRVSLDTITADDLADGELVVGAMQGWEQRLNTLVPKYRSEAHKWEYVAAAEPVTISSYVTEDGEEKREERQIDLVQDETQAAQLCAYELFDRRELGEIEVPCKPRLRRYGPGDLLTIDIPEAGLIEQQAVVLRRSLDPETMGVSLVLRGETPAKHALALGLTGEAPPTPALRTTAEIDQTAVAPTPEAVEQLLIANSYPIGLTISGTDAGSSATVTISAHDRVYQDKTVAVNASTIIGLAYETTYWLYADDADREGGALTFVATTTYANAFTSSLNPARHYIGSILTPAVGGGTSSGGGGTPPGGGGSNPIP